MRNVALSIVLIAVATPAMAQNSSTNCYQLGTGVQCNTTTAPTFQPAPPIDFGRLNQPQPNYAGNAMEAFNRGREQAQQRRLFEQQQELIRLQQEALRRQQPQYAPAPAYRAPNTGAGFAHAVGDYLRKGDCANAVAQAEMSQSEDLILMAGSACASK